MPQQSKIEADPLIVALFGLPTGLHYVVEEEKGGGNSNEHYETLAADDEEVHNMDDRSLAMALVQQKIANIRSTIEMHENDLIAIRNKLNVAHQELESATKELDALQEPKHTKAADDKTYNVKTLQQQQRQQNGHLSLVFASSLRSQISSDHLNYLTPAASIDEGDADFYSLRSNESSDSLDSLPSLSENKNRNRPYIDMDNTPLRGNTIHHQHHHAGKESNYSIETPSTTASTQVGVEEGRQLFTRQRGYIRSHDLSPFRDRNTPLIPLSEEGQGVDAVVDALFKIGFDSAMDDSDRWVPERTTERILSQRSQRMEDGQTRGPMGNWSNAACGDEVLVWTAQCGHDGYGSEYPMVRARGLIPTSSFDMIELLLDSERVKEYNKMSLGRQNEHFYANGVHNPSKCPKTNIHGVAKIVRSRSQPPVVRKPVELRLFLHARRLHSENEDEGAKYLAISRSIWENEDGTVDPLATEATRCEMLLSVNLIRDVNYNGEKWCEMTSLTHGVSPGIPIFIARKAALIAAEKYIKDIRAVFEN